MVVTAASDGPAPQTEGPLPRLGAAAAVPAGGTLLRCHLRFCYVGPWLHASPPGKERERERARTDTVRRRHEALSNGGLRRR